MWRQKNSKQEMKRVLLCNLHIGKQTFAAVTDNTDCEFTLDTEQMTTISEVTKETQEGGEYCAPAKYSPPNKRTFATFAKHEDRTNVYVTEA